MSAMSAHVINHLILASPSPSSSSQAEEEQQLTVLTAKVAPPERISPAPVCVGLFCVFIC